MNLDTRLTILPSAIAEPAADDHLVLDLDSGSYYSLGAAGSFVWSRLDGSRTLAAIAAELATAYDVDAERAARDVVAFAEHLVASNLARAEASAAPAASTPSAD